MGRSIENILSELVFRTAEHFKLDPQEALAVVAQSKVANDLSQYGDFNNLSLDTLSSMLFDEIANAK